MSTKNRQANRTAREQLAADRAAAQAKTARNRRLGRTAAIVATIAVVVGIAAAVQANRATSDKEEITPSAVAANSHDGASEYGFLVGEEDAPVEVTVYEDFQCPACRAFEQSAGATLADLVADGTARVEYRPMAFLDHASTTRYSTRALNAAACAADEGVFGRMHDALFAVQPPEGGVGLDDETLVKVGGQAGATGPGFEECVTDVTYERWTQQATEAASKDGVAQTPTILVNGSPLSAPTPDALKAAVQHAVGS